MHTILFLTLIGQGFWVFAFHHQNNPTLLLHAAIIGDLIAHMHIQLFLFHIFFSNTHTHRFQFNQIS